jgi:hypothetical protein
MDDHERSRSGPAILIVYPDHHAVGEAAAEGLRAAGRETVRAESVYAAVVALAAEPGRFAAAILAIDFFNREELRFFPMAKRRWPELVTAALTEPAFAYKAAIADLAGADFILCDAARAGELVERLTEVFSPQSSVFSNSKTTEKKTATPSPYPLPSRERGEEEETAKEEKETASSSSAGGFKSKNQNRNDRAGTSPAPTKEAEIGERKRRGPHQQSEPAAEAAVVRRPLGELPQKPARPLTTQEILTEEELAALMENMEEDDLPNE